MADCAKMSTENGSTDIPHTCSDLLRPSFFPSAEVYTGIKPLTELFVRQLITIQAKVERLADTSRRSEAKGVLSTRSATFAPIKRLPPEILSEIFEHCLEARSSVPLFSLMRSREAPLLLGRVCHSWRAVAYSTPRLWRDILVSVCDGRYSDELRKDALPVLRTWLAHSGSLPLNLVLLCKTERVLPGLADLFDVIQAHAARWKMVHVRLQNSPVVHRLVCRAFSKCTSLSTFDVTDGGQSVSFYIHRQPDEVENLQPVSFDLSLAPLRHLSLSLAGLSIQDVLAPWTTLTRLSFMQDARSSPSSATDYVAVLRQCVSLKECAITIDNATQDAPLEPFTLPSLECLQFQVLREANQTTQMSDLLNTLDVPCLRTLAIEDCCPRREVVPYHSQLKAFLKTHVQTLRHFKFSTSSKFFTSEDLIALIAETPQLTELEYQPDEESSPRALLEVLTPRFQGDAVECLLPCLERLFMYWDTTETVSMVGDMIERRYELMDRGIARLRYLSCKPVKMSIAYDFMPPYVLVENLAARLEPLCRCGLQVDWEAYRYDLEFLYC